jgi:hypothetical protein
MSQTVIWHMRISCWILKAKNAHSEHVTIIVFPLQPWLEEGASMLRYTQRTLLFFLLVGKQNNSKLHCSFNKLVQQYN